jgi:uncharacterized protein with PIN domain
MTEPEAEVRFAPELRLFLAPRHRAGQVRVACDGVSSLGHVIESLGVPLTEVGSLTVNGAPAAPGCRLAAGDVAEAGAVRRPQPLPSPRFILDVHLGTLARRLRLVGVDVAYANDLDDDALIELANSGRRVLLTQDRGLLRRRRLWLGAYVRGARPDDQLRDVLDRFAPPLAPWTRCAACNGLLAPARKADVEPLLRPGTRRTYQAFSRCLACGRVYWRGAHTRRLEAVVDSALRTVAAAGDRALEAAGDRAPEAARDRAPEAARDRAPEAARDRAPEAARDRAPEAARDRAPEAARDRAPEAAGDRAPEAAGDRAPESPLPAPGLPPFRAGLPGALGVLSGNSATPTRPAKPLAQLARR